MKASTRWLAGVLFALGGFGLFAQTATSTNIFRPQPLPVLEPSYFGEWSAVTEDKTSHRILRARLVVSEVIDEAGTQTAIVCVEFHNPEPVRTTIYIYHSFESPPVSCTLQDASGNHVSPSLFEFVGWFESPCWLALPQDSIIRLSPAKFSRVPASAGKRLIDAGLEYTWIFPRNETNDYLLSGSVTIAVPKGETRPRTLTDTYSPPSTWQGSIRLPAVKIPGNKP